MSDLLFFAVMLTVIVVAWLFIWARDNPPDASGRDGITGRHWRGELPLRGAFWIVYMLGSVAGTLDA